MLLLILGIIFVLGWPLEWVPIVLIVVPILLPLVQKLGIDLVWFCTLVAVCLQTAWLSPPVALSAYFLKGVVPRLGRCSDIYAGMMQFMVLQVIGLLLLLRLPAARAVAARGAARLTARVPAPQAPSTAARGDASAHHRRGRDVGVAERLGHRLAGHLAERDVEAVLAGAGRRPAPSSSPCPASASTNGSVALLSANVDVRGTPPGMLATQ